MPAWRSTFKALLISSVAHGSIFIFFLGSSLASPAGESVVVELFDVASVLSAPRRPVRTAQGPRSNKAKANQAVATAAPPEEPIPTAYDLTAIGSSPHPFFQKVWRQLATAQRNLGLEPGSYSVQFKLQKDGRLEEVKVDGRSERNSMKIAEELRKLAFLPSVPDEISREPILIRYRVEVVSNP